VLPLSVFSSRQFTAANAVTFVVYGAMSGVFFLLVVVLQTALGYSAVAAGTAELPITVILLLFAARGGALAQRIGPRTPLTLGPLLIAAAMLLMLRIEPGAGYLRAVLPPLVVFGAGLVFVVAPVTATVLAAVDDRQTGVASGVNNAVARTASLVAVAALPLVAGLTGEAYLQPDALTEAFHRAMVVSAAVAAAGGMLAWCTIRDEALRAGGETSTPVPGPAAAGPPEPEHQFTHCAVAGPPLRTTPAQCQGDERPPTRGK
jgi:predicted MFS family arabinose efflux permease